jgi:DNA-binding CsgD family transcriptional regulator
MDTKISSRWPYPCPIKPKQWFILQRKYHLTNRELQLVICICRGCNNLEAAKKMEIELNTAKVHLANVYRKMGISNKVHMLLKFLADVKA